MIFINVFVISLQVLLVRYVKPTIRNGVLGNKDKNSNMENIIQLHLKLCLALKMKL